MTPTTLAELLREAAGSHRDFCIDESCTLSERLLAAVEELKGMALMPIHFCAFPEEPDDADKA